MGPRRSKLVLPFVLALVPLHAGEPAQRPAEDMPSTFRWVGQSEIQRAAGDQPRALQTLLRAADAPDSQRHLVALHDLICWQMLPKARADVPGFQRQLRKLRQSGAESSWLPVYEAYAALLEQDRAALLALAARPPLPESYPTVLAEKCHGSLLREQGQSEVRAGLEVISHRSPDALHALRELDRSLTRETVFLRTAGREAEAKQIEGLRDHLRQGYLKAGRHLVERLFALQLLGMTTERDALLTQARACPYLTDRQKLGALLDQVDEAKVWTLVIQPLLDSEVRLLQTPPDLGRLQAPTASQVKIEAREKASRGNVTTYEGAVKVRVGNLHITCDRLSVIQEAERTSTTLVGNGAVVVGGIIWSLGGLENIAADRFTFSSDTGGFSFGGEVRVKKSDGVLKLRSCSATWGGELRDQRSLLDDFRDAPDVARRLALLPAITRVYTDEELPAEVRYLLALRLLRSHLSWHAPHREPKPRGEEKLRDVQKEGDPGEDGGRWREALGGEDWMLADVPKPVRDALPERLKEPRPEGRARPTSDERAEPFFWRIKDPAHADVARAQRLLDSVHQGDLGSRARRWAAEVRRNNTVLTFDVVGGYAPGKDAALVMDVRNVDRVAFKVYRVRQPEELLWVAARIGDDFLYRDYGLRHGEGNSRLQERLQKATRAMRRERDDVSAGADLKKPEFRPEDVVREWVARPAELKALSLWHSRWFDDDWEDWNPDADARYFDDACERFRERIAKRYHPQDQQLTSWHCDRLVEVPGAALREPGAYVLAAEANGQTAYAPLLVDPLSLTLRRCRDGVFVLASDREGKEPVAGARVHGKGMLGEAVTDAAGAAFARLFAGGERAILIHKDGRFAIGGFGRLFDGLYVSPFDREWHDRDFLRRLQEAKDYAREPLAQVYADRHLVAVYTDRPTYRPGQEVHFKLLVRQLTAERRAAGGASTFRAEDFDVTSRMELPPEGTQLRYAVLDPRGREVGEGVLVLNDHGTAAARIGLNEETATGLYSLRVHVSGMDRLVPEVFAVRHYRRPTFELKVAGVPEKLKQSRDLTLDITGRYYFGMPVAGGQLMARLLGAERWRPFAEAEAKLDVDGAAKLKLELPEDLAPGRYHVVCSLTDDSGRVVSQSLPVELEGSPAARAGKGLAALPRFVPTGQPLTITTTAVEIIAEQAEERQLAFRAEKGTAMVKLPRPGWYRLWAGDESTVVFAYGGQEQPLLSAVPPHSRLHGPPKPGQERQDEPGTAPGWVNLTDYRAEVEGRRTHTEHDGQQLLALFDRQHVLVGDRLRVLVYAPYPRARLLFTIEGRTVVDYFLTWTPAGDSHYHVIEIPIKERHRPNFYLQGRILYGEQADKEKAGRKGVRENSIEKLREAPDSEAGEDPRWCRIDVLALGKALGDEKLTVDVQTGRADYRPGDEVEVRLKVTDRDGRPRVAEVSLGAVDESVYVFGEDGLRQLPLFFGSSLAPQQFTPKAWRSSRGDRWDMRKHAVSLQDQAIERLQKAVQEAKSASADVQRDALASLAPSRSRRPAVPLPALGGELPVTSFPLARLRADFRETATWQPQLRTGTDGIVKTTFKLPDTLTEYRLTAVALTRDTEIGIGKASLRASLPLAVQLILPRFAVEKDRLLAIGLIHNNSERERTCRVGWEVEGSNVDGAHALQDWRSETIAGKSVGQGSIKVPARGTARVGIWLAPSKAGTARITLRCADEKDADVETRPLAIQALGRPREVATNAVLPEAAPQAGREAGLKGTFHHHQRLTLPAGFSAQELRISLSCVDTVQALDGIGYLVEYPHGCVEQTMSRFLPAVMVKHASQRAPITLPPEVAARLPEVLQRGLTRLSNFQHADGSWGWFGRDERDVAMTTYVVYGLARCQAAGVPIDRAMLDRGCEALKGELRKGRLDADLAARAWLAVAVAGRAEQLDLQTFAQAALRQASPEARANLALACRWVGLNEEGERLWALIRRWQPEGTDRLALKLNAQVAFGAPFDDCRQSARQLLALRSGDRWEHTRATSWAIEALSNLLAYVPERVPVRHAQVLVGGKPVLDVTDPTELKRLVYRAHLPGEQLPSQDPLEIVLAADCDEPMRYSIRAVGTQRLDRLEPEGKRIRVQRSIETLEGKPITGPLPVGQVIAVRLVAELEQDEQYVIVEDRRPSGLEFADERLTGRAGAAAAHAEFRDDRVCAFYPTLRAGRHEIIYYLRAETPGVSHLLPGCAYPMYGEKVRGETGSARLEVRGP